MNQPINNTRRSRAWIYCLWGDPKHPQCRGEKVRKAYRDFAWAAKRMLDPPTIVYVYGKDNDTMLQSWGFKTVRLSDDPAPHIPVTLGPQAERIWWEHKTNAWLAALEDYDEIVYRDCDIRAWQSIDADTEELIWRRLRQKGSFQANLLAYPSAAKKCAWRKGFSAVPDLHINRVSSGGFIYLADRKIVQQFLEIMKQNPRLDDERAMSYWVDQQHGGWQGLEHWAENYEPFCCHIKNSGLTAPGSQRHGYTPALGQFIAQKWGLFTYWESDRRAWEHEAT